MKESQNRLFSLLLAGLTLVSSGALLTGCGSDTSTTETEPPKAVTDLQLDFESGEFSFTGVEDATSYYVRIFEANPSEEDADMPLAARRIRVREDNKATGTFSGTVALDDLQPGDSYNAYVFSYKKDDNGDLVYTQSEAVNGTYKTTYDAPSGDGISTDIEGNTVTITLTNDFFTTEYLDKAPDYQVNLYVNGTQSDSLTLTNSDLQIEESTSTNMFGMEVTTTTTTAAAVFTVSDPAAFMTATVTLLSTDDTAYYSSEEGEAFAVTVAAEEPAAEDEGETGGEYFGS